MKLVRRMKKELTNMTIHYHACDLAYIEDIVKKLEKKGKEILQFFHLQHLEKHLNIYLWDDVKQFEENVHPRHAYTIGKANFKDHRIDVLSYQEILKREGHQQDSIESISDLILHEFVHICHGQYAGPDYGCWVNEALATTISGQYDQEPLNLNCNLEHILNGTWHICYATMGKYILNQYGRDYFLKLAKDQEFAIQETKRLYEEAKAWVLEQKTQPQR